MQKFFTLVVAASSLLCANAAFAAVPSGLTIVPGDGATVDEITTLTITSTTGFLEVPSGSESIRINGAKVATTYQVSTADASTMDDVITFTLVNPVTAPGTYNVIVPDGAFDCYFNGETFGEININITVNDNGQGAGDDDDPIDDPEIDNIVPEGFTITPSGGDKVAVLTEITITGDKEDAMFLYPTTKPDITVNGKVVDVLSKVSGEYENVLTWTFGQPFTEAGYYHIRIPAGAFWWGIGDTDSEEFLITVIVEGGDAPIPPVIDDKYTVNPDRAVKELSEITLTFAENVSVLMGPDADKATISDSEELLDNTLTLSSDLSGDYPNVLTIALATPITEAGEYTVEIPAQAIKLAEYLDTHYNCAITLKLTVDPEAGITDVSIDNETAAVYYNLQGVRVANPTSGMYIVKRGTTVSKAIIK